MAASVGGMGDRGPATRAGCSPGSHHSPPRSGNWRRAKEVAGAERIAKAPPWRCDGVPFQNATTVKRRVGAKRALIDGALPPTPSSEANVCRNWFHDRVQVEPNSLPGWPPGVGPTSWQQVGSQVGAKVGSRVGHRVGRSMLVQSPIECRQFLQHTERRIRSSGAPSSFSSEVNAGAWVDAGWITRLLASPIVGRLREQIEALRFKAAAASKPPRIAEGEHAACSRGEGSVRRGRDTGSHAAAG